MVISFIILTLCFKSKLRKIPSSTDTCKTKRQYDLQIVNLNKNRGTGRSTTELEWEKYPNQQIYINFFFIFRQYFERKNLFPVNWLPYLNVLLFNKNTNKKHTQFPNVLVMKKYIGLDVFRLYHCQIILSEDVV